MKQRVVIALSTLLSPKILIADEPTSALDVSSQQQLLSLLHALVNSGIINSLIYISHDICTLRQICDDILIMDAGKQVEYAPLESIIKYSLHPYTQLLLNAVTSLDPDIRNKELEGIPGGHHPNLINPPKSCFFQERYPYAKEHRRQEEPQFIMIKQNRYVACWFPEMGRS
jgi:peptide/nickel transport system ATP-binding protein